MRLEMQFEFTGFEAGHFGGLFDEMIQAVAFLVDDGEQFLAVMRIDVAQVPGREQAGDRGFDGGQRSAEIMGDGIKQGGFQTLALALGFRLAELLDGAGAFDGDGDRLPTASSVCARKRAPGNTQAGDGTHAQANRNEIERLLRLDRRFVAHECGLHAFFVEMGGAESGAVKFVFERQEKFGCASSKVSTI